MAVRKAQVLKVLRVSDGSFWGLMEGWAFRGCEVCGAKPAGRWACLSGNWTGAVCVACGTEHAKQAIEEFINYGKRKEETS